MEIWSVAYENTKVKRYIDSYVSTCKTCNKAVNNKPTRERQLIGNCYQNITTCSVCSNTFVLDEHQDYEWFLSLENN